MKRWRSERALMLRRWRQEIAKHEGRHSGEAPLPPSGDHLCHCYRGAGFLRKRRPHGCGRPRCGICKWGKYYLPKARATKKHEAIRFDLLASGSLLQERPSGGYRERNVAEL